MYPDTALIGTHIPEMSELTNRYMFVRQEAGGKTTAQRKRGNYVSKVGINYKSTQNAGFFFFWLHNDGYILPLHRLKFSVKHK